MRVQSLASLRSRKFIFSMVTSIVIGSLTTSSFASESEQQNEWLVKVQATTAAQVRDTVKQNNEIVSRLQARFAKAGAKIENVSGLRDDGTIWLKAIATTGALSKAKLKEVKNVVYVQSNYVIHLLENPSMTAAAQKFFANNGGFPDFIGSPQSDNPAIPMAPPKSGTGADPLYSKQWGMNDINSKNGWTGKSGNGMVVAVIDTGVDYTHEDLVENLWYNAGEIGKDASGKDKSSNGVDDDTNGYIDDVIGWDFVSNDNKPFDLTASMIDMLLGGGNPGHGTHCAGNVAARNENGVGIAGVAPKAKIMPLRFLGEKGQGSTDGAIKAIKYSVKMGVKVTSNSWGSEGEDPAEKAENQALKDAIDDARKAGQLFIAAAGNGHNGAGYDNDTDAKPGYPASYSFDNIISVAAIDKNDGLGSFSNWGKKTVHIAAPGVAVFSTTSDGQYNDSVIPGMATWDGTSMATPHVAGAAALYWADHPNATVADVKNAILKSAKPIPALNGKVQTDGKLSIENLMKQP